MLFWFLQFRSWEVSEALFFSLSLSLCVSGGEDFQKGLVDGGSRNAKQVG